jgi:predicted nucleotide-binding protein
MTAMLKRFEGTAGRRLRIEALLSQKMVGSNRALAELLADMVKLRALAKHEILINQGATDNEVYFVISGSVSVLVNGRTVARRVANDHVGEMAAIEPTQSRAASVAAEEETIVASIAESELSTLGDRYPEIYRCMARELARRLLQRNRFVTARRERIIVFIISSAEAISIAREIQNAFEHDNFTTVIWTDGVFKATGYALQSLENQIEDSDFAIAIAHADDTTNSRGKDWPAPRDNVIFELGLCMGKLGRHRAILMEPRDNDVKLPSDLAGITTIPYRYEVGKTVAAMIAPACNRLRDHINEYGPNN